MATSVGVVIALHLTLLAPVLIWKAPLIAQAATDQISLITLSGKITPPTTLPSQSQSAPVIPPKPLDPTPSLEPAAPLASTKPSQLADDLTDPDLTASPVSVTPIDVQKVVLNILSGAPAQPTPKPTPAATAIRAKASADPKACQILDNLEVALRTSEPVRQALPLIPKRARSVANAVMLWDGRWVDQSTLGGERAVGSIRQTVLQIVQSAPPSCQSELVRGPRLITIGDAQSTTVLAFGSGEWRWADLLGG